VLSSLERFDCVIVHFEILPYFPDFPEAFITRQGIPFFLDLDDAIFHQYDSHSNPLWRFLFRDKIAAIMRMASGVVAGNGYIARYAEEAGCERVEVIPTVIDLDRYQLVKDHAVDDSGRICIGWMGSRSTAAYLDDTLPVLEELNRVCPLRLLVVGAKYEIDSSFPVESRPWREDREIEDLIEMDIGMMPLPDTPWERGKCGYKLIQYMASSLPVVASPVGVNSSIVEHGVNGFLASGKKQWFEALRLLADNAEQRQSFGRNGRKKVEREYSLQVTAPRWVKLLEACPKS
jgi:glycosyltransferase involved in cell wall biosynthesis